MLTPSQLGVFLVFFCSNIGEAQTLTCRSAGVPLAISTFKSQEEHGKIGHCQQGDPMAYRWPPSGGGSCGGEEGRPGFTPAGSLQFLHCGPHVHSMETHRKCPGLCALIQEILCPVLLPSTREASSYFTWRI